MHAVIHDEQRQRFLVQTDQGECVLEYRREGPAVWDFHHTYVPPELRGHEIASDLTTFALNYARTHHIWVIPSCPYVSAFIEKHPEFKDLIA